MELARKNPVLLGLLCSACVLAWASIVAALLARYGPLIALFDVVWLVGVPMLTLGFVCFDVLIRTEYRLRHSAWLADGKPSGASFGLENVIGGTVRGPERA
jgi:hypothetical protein